MANYLKPTCAFILPPAGSYFIRSITKSDLNNWLKTLKRPSFTLPYWLLKPSMFAGYGCVGYGAYLIWQDWGGFQGDAVLPLTCYGATLALTWSVPPVLSRTRSLRGLVIFSVSVLGATVATAVTFKQANSTAGYLVLPFLGFVLYSNIVNFSLWRNN